MHLQPVNPAASLNEILEEHPQALRVFHQFGFDTCCGGTLPLSTVTQRHGVDLQVVLKQLAALQGPVGTRDDA